MPNVDNEIVFNRPALVGRELEYIRRAIEAGHASGDGPFTRRACALLEQALGVPRALLTTSCTDALEMCALLLGLGPGDEVIVPSYTFVSSANAFALRGARPVFADVRPDTLNLDETRLEERIGPRTRAIVVVHYAGVGCEMSAIQAVAERHGVPVVEDNAHGLFARYRGRPLGGFGTLATLSFHETKNFSCGEGGALLINDPALIERAEILRDKGTNRQQLFRGQVDKYTWVDLGSSFVLSDLLAAYLLGQLEARERILAGRREVWEGYDAALRGPLSAAGVGLPTVPPHCEQSYHMYYLVTASLAQRQALIARLAAERICAVFHYTPLHLSRMGRSFGGARGQCPVSESVSERVVRLPFYYGLGTAERERVVRAVLDFFGAGGGPGRA